jgi:hypothetical protein
MIDALLTMATPGAVPGVPMGNGEAQKPAAAAAEGFGAALALLLAPKAVAAPGETVAVEVAGEPVGAPTLAAEQVMTDAVGVGLAGALEPDAQLLRQRTAAPAVAPTPLPVAADEPAKPGDGEVAGARMRPQGRELLAKAMAVGGEPRVERRLKNGSAVKPLAEAGETVGLQVPVPVTPPLFGLVAAPTEVAMPADARVVPPVPVMVAAPVVGPVATKPMVEPQLLVAAPVLVATVAIPRMPDVRVPPGGAAPAIAGEPAVDMAAGLLPAVAIEVEQQALRVPDHRVERPTPVPPARFVADLPLPPVVAAVLPAPRGDGARREFEAIPVVEPVVSAATSVGLPGVSGGNPVVRGGAGDGSPVAPPAPAAGEQQFSVASDTLGPVDIGVDGGGEDLRVRFSAEAGAARVMAAEAPRLLADLAAQGVRVQALAFDGRAETGLAAGADGSPAQQSPGQPGGQPGFAAGRQAAALPESAVTGSGAGSRIPRISERYA